MSRELLSFTGGLGVVHCMHAKSTCFGGKTDDIASPAARFVDRPALRDSVTAAVTLRLMQFQKIARAQIPHPQLRPTTRRERGSCVWYLADDAVVRFENEMMNRLAAFWHARIFAVERAPVACCIACQLHRVAS